MDNLALGFKIVPLLRCFRSRKRVLRAVDPEILYSTNGRVGDRAHKFGNLYEKY